MQSKYSEPCRSEPTCEIRVGASSWDDKCTSVKFTWFNSSGGAARGGEVPIEALPQMLEVAIREGGLRLDAPSNQAV